MQRTLIVIPTYNEIENLQPLLELVCETTPRAVEMLVVDDGSPDGTGQLAREMSNREPRIHLLEREKKSGLRAAYIAGFHWGLSRGYEWFIEMDADFSHHPRYLSKMLHHLPHADFVIGSRYVPGGGTRNWGLGRKVISRGGSLYARTILGVSINDFTGGFNGWNRHVLEAIGLDSFRSEGYSFQIELKYRASRMGYRFKEFPIVFEDRKVGQSKMSKKIVFEALKKVWDFRLEAPQKQPPAKRVSKTSGGSEPEVGSPPL